MANKKLEGLVIDALKKDTEGAVAIDPNIVQGSVCPLMTIAQVAEVVQLPNGQLAGKTVMAGPVPCFRTCALFCEDDKHPRGGCCAITRLAMRS